MVVTDTWAAAGVVTTTAGAEAVVIITDGPGAAVIAITDKPSLDSRSPFHCPGERELQRQERVAPTGAAGSAGSERGKRVQPSSISTAIRIRSE
jgi:hypothetical protein